MSYTHIIPMDCSAVLEKYIGTVAFKFFINELGRNRLRDDEMLDGIKTIFQAILTYREVNTYTCNLVHGRKLYYKNENFMPTAMAVSAVSNIVDIVDEEEQVFFDAQEIDKILPPTGHAGGHLALVDAAADIALWLKFISNLSDLSAINNSLPQQDPLPQVQPTAKRQGKTKENALALAKYDLEQSPEKKSKHSEMLEVGILSLQGEGLCKIAVKFGHTSPTWTTPRRTNFIKYMEEEHGLDVSPYMPTPPKKDT